MNIRSIVVESDPDVIESEGSRMLPLLRDPLRALVSLTRAELIFRTKLLVENFRSSEKVAVKWEILNEKVSGPSAGGCIINMR